MGGASTTGGKSAAGGGAVTGGVSAAGGKSATGGLSATGGASAATGGSSGGSNASSTLVNTYDGERATTASFDLGWKFHLGDVTGAQATTFDDSSWTSLDVPHDWSISLAFNQSSASGAGGGYLDGGTGWSRKTFTLPAASSGQKFSFSSTAST